MCRFRISAHDLRIESNRYATNYINRTDRIFIYFIYLFIRYLKRVHN